MACQFDSHLVTSADYSVSMKVTSKIAIAGFLGLKNKPLPRLRYTLPSRALDCRRRSSGINKLL